MRLRSCSKHLCERLAPVYEAAKLSRSLRWDPQLSRGCVLSRACTTLTRATPDQHFVYGGGEARAVEASVAFTDTHHDALDGSDGSTGHAMVGTVEADGFVLVGDNNEASGSGGGGGGSDGGRHLVVCPFVDPLAVEYQLYGPTRRLARERRRRLEMLKLRARKKEAKARARAQASRSIRTSSRSAARRR